MICSVQAEQTAFQFVSFEPWKGPQLQHSVHSISAVSKSCVLPTRFHIKTCHVTICRGCMFVAGCLDQSWGVQNCENSRDLWIPLVENYDNILYDNH